MEHFKTVYSNGTTIYPDDGTSDFLFPGETGGPGLLGRIADFMKKLWYGVFYCQLCQRSYARFKVKAITCPVCKRHVCADCHGEMIEQGFDGCLYCGHGEKKPAPPLLMGTAKKTGGVDDQPVTIPSTRKPKVTPEHWIKPADPDDLEHPLEPYVLRVPPSYEFETPGYERHGYAAKISDSWPVIRKWMG